MSDFQERLAARCKQFCGDSEQLAIDAAALKKRREKIENDLNGEMLLFAAELVRGGMTVDQADKHLEEAIEKAFAK